jgi:nucleotide-binding universal stress UspA family protein
VSVLPEKFLLATDGSDDAALAARAAADITEGFGSELHVVHVLEPYPRFAYPGVTSEVYSYVLEEEEEEGRELLIEQAKRIRDGGMKVTESHLRRGPIVDEILDLAEEIGAGLVVLGGRGLGSVKRLALGSVSEGVVHHAACPVLVVRGGERAWPPARVLIADDGSEAAGSAGELGAALGKVFLARGLLLRARPRFRYEISREGRVSQLDEFYEALRKDEKELKKRAGKLEDVLGSRPEVEVVEGDAAAAVVREAERTGEATLVAVGSRGLGPVKRLRLGSVSTKVVRAAPGPVLVCPHPSG